MASFMKAMCKDPFDLTQDEKHLIDCVKDAMTKDEWVRRLDEVHDSDEWHDFVRRREYLHRRRFTEWLEATGGAP